MIISNCKINLGLNIISKREDGYHELDMIMAPIIFGDEIDIICHDELGELEFRIKDDLIPIDKSNTVTKAYNEYFEYSNKEKRKVSVYLEKRVPRQAGLGGGSSNAGFLLTELNKKYKFYSKDEMLVIAKKVGADVPFFVYEYDSANVTGIGEIVKKFDEEIFKKFKTVDRYRVLYQQRQILLEQIKLKAHNQQKLMDNEVEILSLAQQDQDRDTWFRLERALESYQKIHKAVLNDRIRLENEH